MNSSFDILIVGNGILGLSTAYALSQQNTALKINIIGCNNRMGGATIAAGAMLNCFAEITSTTFKTEYSKAKFEMARQAGSLWQSWLENINSYLSKDSQLKINPGTYIILNNKSGTLDTENYDATLKALLEYNEPFENVDSHSIPGMNAVSDCRPLRSIYLPNEGAIDSAQVLQALEYILKQNPNITFTPFNASSIKIGKDNTKYVTTANGSTHTASRALLANGAFTQHLLDQLPDLSKSIPRLFAGTGYSLLIEQDPSNIVQHVIRTPNRAGACGLHVLPRSCNSLYIGATNNVCYEPNTSPSLGLIHFLMECGIAQINQNLYSSKVKCWTVGNRPATIDTFPLIGETSITGLWVLSGTYRDGFHQSPLLGQHMAKVMLGQKGLFENKFSPERALIKTFTKQESIEEFKKHYLAGGYEHSMCLPKFMTYSVIEKMIEEKVTQLYSQLDTSYGLAPDMLLMLELETDPTVRIKFLKEYLASVTT